MLDGQQDLYLCPAAWNPPPAIYTPTHTEAYRKQPALEGGVSCLTNHIPWGRRGFWPPPATRPALRGPGQMQVTAAAATKGSRLEGCACCCRLCAELSRVPPARGEPAWVPPQSFPRQRRDPRQDSFLISEMAQVSITFRGGLNNKHERQQINEMSRIFKPCKMLVFFCIPSSPRLPSQVRAKGFQIWQESRQQILLKCKLPQFH